MHCCNIYDTFAAEDLLVKNYTHWGLYVRNRNTTLGNCVAITKRHMERFSEIRPEEMKEFAHVVSDVEHALGAAFSPDKMNYQMLMMVDSHTHFHIIPRYASSREFAGRTWVDEGWPKLPGPLQEPVSVNILQRVRDKLRGYL